MSSLRLSIETNGSSISSALGRFDQEMAQAVASAMNDQNALLVSHIQQNKLTTRGSNSLAVDTGTLRQSVNATPASISGDGVSSSVGTNVFYALIHELGCGPYTIVPKNASVLSFKIGGQQVFTKKVNHPGFPARRMFETALEETSQEYSDALLRAMGTAIDNL